MAQHGGTRQRLQPRPYSPQQLRLAVVAALSSARGATASSAGGGLISLAVESYPAEPVLSFLAGTTAWEFSYNPAFLPGRSAGGAGGGGGGGWPPPAVAAPAAADTTAEISGSAVPSGLFVRVQNGSAAPAGTCGHPASESFVAFAPFDTRGEVQPLGPGVVFRPLMTPWEQTAEDPRVVYDAVHERWIMTYTANGIVSEGSQPPMNRHQGIATSRNPLGGEAAWERQCSASSPCVPPGFKSGAMLLRSAAAAAAATTGDTHAPRPRHGPASHYMFLYDLRKACPANPGGVCRHTVVATSADALRWTLLNRTLLPRRPGMWDAGLIEPGPPPLQVRY
jgi:hypothetical protein